MRFRTLTIAVAALGSTMGVISAPATAAPAPAPAVALAQSSSPAATPANRLGATPAATQIDFSVGLQLRDPAGAVALQRAVSDPASADYRHFLGSGPVPSSGGGEAGEAILPGGRERMDLGIGFMF